MWRLRPQEEDYLRSVELIEGRDQVFEHLRCMYFMDDLKAYFLYFSADLNESTGKSNVLYWRFKMLLTQNNTVFSSNESTRFQSITARGWKSRNRNFPRNQFIRNLTLACLKLQKLLQTQKVGYFEKENYLWKLNFVWHTCSKKITLSLRSNFCKHKKLATLKRKIIYENLILYDTLVVRKLRFL